MTATGYIISYYNTNNTGCFNDTRSGITTRWTSYSLTGLEEGTQYSITVTATLNGGMTEQDTVTVNATLTEGRTEQDTITATTRTAGQSISQSLLSFILISQLHLPLPHL